MEITHDTVLPAFPGRLTMTGLQLAGGVAFGEWQELLHRLMVMQEASSWWLGDALNYGEAQYGQMYAQALEVTGKAYSTLTNLKYVASRIPEARRREGLSLSHHAEVAGLPSDEQDRWLEEAEAQGWSVSRLRSARQSFREVKPEPEQPPMEALTRFFEEETQPAPPEPETDQISVMTEIPSDAVDAAVWAYGKGSAVLSSLTDDEIEAAYNEEQEDGFFTNPNAEADIFQRQVGLWADRTFRQATPESICAHLRREAREVSLSGEAEEAADCFLLLLHFAHKKGFSLMEEARRKFEINKCRAWGEPDGEGVVEHIRAEAE